jgi:Cu(I)/Ag(I) efflux system membrane fusion protein
MTLAKRHKTVLFSLLLAVTALLIALCGCDASDRPPRDSAQGEPDGTFWTCSMHPQVRAQEPGDCPICGMDLIPVEGAAGTMRDEGRRLTVTDAERKLMEISTTPVVRRHVDAEVRLVGVVAYDETSVSRIAAWVPGRIERLHVDYVGYVVAEREAMVDIYAPGLVASQEELIQARQAVERSSSGDAASARRTLDAVRDRLGRWGLSPEQILEIEERGSPEERVTLLAPIGGTVVEKNVAEGMYVSTGTVIYTIADLSRVWVELAAYESDLAVLSEGDGVEFTTGAHPGITFEGAIAFIEPVLNPSTRTAVVRVEAENASGKLKPEMFARALIRARVGSAEDAPLVIPASAPLLTGTRAVVYVEVPGAEIPTYEGRDVTLGPRAGDYYVVASGLAEGERVVTEGNFKIDSALQIRARPSMMNPEGGAAAPVQRDHGSLGSDDGPGVAKTSDAHSGH